MVRSADRAGGEQRRVDDDLARWIGGVAHTLVRRGRVPERLREDAQADAELAMVVAWSQGGVRDRSGLWQVGWRAVRASALSGRSTLSLREARDLRRGDGDALPTLALIDLTDRAADAGAWGSATDERSQSADGSRLADLLDALRERLVGAGMDPTLVAAALDALVDLSGEVGGGGRAVYELRSDVLGERLGLDPLDARALVVLVIGDPKRPGREGIVARDHRGDDVWSDRRVAVLVEEVVRPRRARLRNAWAPLVAGAD